MERHILTVDVEDNFTYEELTDKADWPHYERQVVTNTVKVLDMMKGFSAKATFFVVGKVAERHPELVRQIHERGHEVASHSYAHSPLRSLPLNAVEKDVKRSLEVLRSLTGAPVIGFRAMGYSIPDDRLGFYDILKRHGCLYDSSMKYSDAGSLQTVVTHKNGLYSVLPSAIDMRMAKVVFSGGTYFRIMPMAFINRAFSSYARSNQPVMLYVHPWEFNKDQPRREIPFTQSLLQSPVTFTTEAKLKCLLSRHCFASISEYLGL